jgi:hypothetical protein
MNKFLERVAAAAAALQVVWESTDRLTRMLVIGTAAAVVVVACCVAYARVAPMCPGERSFYIAESLFLGGCPKR